MTDTSGRRARQLRCFAVLLVIAFLGVNAEAASHRARLSEDVAQRLAAGSDDSSSVIISGTDAQIQILAARYGARVKKTVRGGAVLDLTGGQLAALAADPDVDHVSGDVQVRRMMAVTTEETGATQVWGGLEGLRGYTGRGVGV